MCNANQGANRRLGVPVRPRVRRESPYKVRTLLPDRIEKPKRRDQPADGRLQSNARRASGPGYWPLCVLFDSYLDKSPKLHRSHAGGLPLETKLHTTPTYSITSGHILRYVSSTAVEHS